MLAVTVRKCVIQRCITPVQRSALCCTPGLACILTVFVLFYYRFLRGINRFFVCVLLLVTSSRSPQSSVDCHRGFYTRHCYVVLVVRPLAVLRYACPRGTSNASVVTYFDFNRADVISSVLSDVLSDVRVNRGATTFTYCWYW